MKGAGTVAITGKKAAAGGAKSRNPLEPLASVTSGLLFLFAALVAMAIVATVVGSGSVLGWGRDASVCVDTPGLYVSGTGIKASGYQMNAGVDVMTSGYRFCVASPSTAQRLWFTLQQLPATVAGVGGLVLALLFIRHAERHGLYAAGVAVRLRVLGWFLLAVTVVMPLVQQFATTRLTETMTTGTSGPVDAAYHWPWLTGLVGVAVLSFARIMRQGAVMREDLEGVV
jgi:hypothetical protein